MSEYNTKKNREISLLSSYNHCVIPLPPIRVKWEKPEPKEPEVFKVTEDWRDRKERRVKEVRFPHKHKKNNNKSLVLSLTIV